MNREFKFLVVIIFLLMPTISFAQNINNKATNTWQKKVTKVFDKMKYDSILKDSIAIYNYHIELRLEKSKNGKVKIMQLVPSDKIVYNLFPNYKQLYAINYSDLLRNKKSINLYIPILVFSTSPSGASRYERQNNSPLVYIGDAATVASNALNAISLFYNKGFKNIRVATPILIQVFNTPDKYAIQREVYQLDIKPSSPKKVELPILKLN